MAALAWVQQYHPPGAPEPVAAIVTRVRADGSVDIFAFVPNTNGVYVESVPLADLVAPATA